MNSAAWRARASPTRSSSATNVSSVRVMATRYLPVFSSLSRSISENSSTMVFSISPPGPLVPLSMPPWPGSITTSGRGSPAAFSGSRSSLRLSGTRRKLERDLRHVDHHPVGIGEREGTDVDLLAEIDHHAGLGIVAGEAHVAGDGKIVGRTRRRRGRAGTLGRGRAADDHGAEKHSQAHRADRHRSFQPPPGLSYSITRARLT